MAPTVLVPTRPKTPAGTGGFGRQGTGSRGRGFGGDGDEGRYGQPWAIPLRTYRTGMWIGLAAITMLFAAFTSALVVRKGISNDWRHTELPPVLWLNTLVLLASSATIELSRRSLPTGPTGPTGSTEPAGVAGLTPRFGRWLQVTLVLGLIFVAGQLSAWRELAGRGVYLATNPSSSFFYLLTAAHGVHLLGGIVAVSYLVLRADKVAPAREAPRAAGRVVLDVTAMYWHFMDGLWIYLFLLLRMRS